MTLYRCSTPKKRSSFKFLEVDEIHAVGEVLEPTVWLDHFQRKGGINIQGITRFGPLGYPKWPLYASEKKDTTYYEFAYWKLKNWQDELDVPTNAATISFNFIPQQKPVNVFGLPDQSSILDLSTYVHAHDWLQKLVAVPESISYPSVRDPVPGGINFSIYEGQTAKDPVLLENLIMIVRSQIEVEVIVNNKASVFVKPIK